MTIKEQLSLMDEINRKNNAAWDRFKTRPRTNHGRIKPISPHLHPGTEFLLKCLITCCAVFLFAAVALLA